MKIFFLILLFTTNSYSQVLIPYHRLKTSEYTAYADNKNLELFSKYYLENYPSEKNSNHILNLFEKGQTVYLSGEKKQSQEFFESITALSQSEDWKLIHRKMIFLSFIRLAEIDFSNEDRHLQSAMEFGPEISLERMNIPDYLVQKIKKKRSLIKSTLWNLTTFKKDFSYILINGHEVDLKKNSYIRLPSGKYRITFLSDIYKPQTLFLNSQQVPMIEPIRSAFLHDQCASLLVPEVAKEIITYSGKECLEPILPAPYVNVQAVEIKQKPFYKKNWFWIAAGTITTGTVIYFVSKNKKGDSRQSPSSDQIIMN